MPDPERPGLGLTLISTPEEMADRYVFRVEAAVSRYAAAAETVALHAPERVLFHCSAGKDRTGLVAAAMLSMLDVSDPTSSTTTPSAPEAWRARSPTRPSAAPGRHGLRPHSSDRIAVTGRGDATVPGDHGRPPRWIRRPARVSWAPQGDGDVVQGLHAGLTHQADPVPAAQVATTQ